MRTGGDRAASWAQGPPILSLRTTAHPLDTRFAKRKWIGAAVSGTAGRYLDGGLALLLELTLHGDRELRLVPACVLRIQCTSAQRGTIYPSIGPELGQRIDQPHGLELL